MPVAVIAHIAANSAAAKAICFIVELLIYSGESYALILPVP
jgi:hypothetical protein